jgi:hypothetical protein
VFAIHLFVNTIQDQHHFLVIGETVLPLDKGRFTRERRGLSSSAISIVNKPPSSLPVGKSRSPRPQGRDKLEESAARAGMRHGGEDIGGQRETFITKLDEGRKR